MKPGKGRSGRQDNQKRMGANNWRSTRRVRCAALLAVLAVAATAAVWPRPPRGRLSAFGGAAAAGPSIAFTPMRSAVPPGTAPASTAGRSPAVKCCGRTQTGRRPPQSALRDHGQVRLSRPLPDHPGDQSRPLPRAIPTSRSTAHGWRLASTAPARSTTRSRSPTPGTDPPTLLPPRAAICPCSSSIFDERSSGTWRGLPTGRPARIRPAGAVGWPGCGAGGGVPDRPCRPGRERCRGDGTARHGRARADRGARRTPSCPGSPLRGDRQRHRLSAQQRSDQDSPSTSPRRQDHGLDPDFGPADPQTTLFLRTASRHPARGAVGDPGRVPRTNPPRYALLSQSSIHVLSPYLGRAGVRHIAEGEQGRHRGLEPVSNLGPPPRPATAHRAGSAGQPDPR